MTVFRKRRILLNALTFVPGVSDLPLIKRLMRNRIKGTGGTSSARYCYSVWLRHLVLASESNLNTNPQTIAELGPGDSLGIGLAALLSGAGKYLAFDVHEYASAERNLTILDELLQLFKERTAIPDEVELPGVSPKLRHYAFPSSVLTEARMNAALDPERIDTIKNSLRNCKVHNSLIQYRVPWQSENVIEHDSIDLVYSQAVLEHVEALDDVYACMHSWLKPTGFISHQIDLKCHGWAKEWNGHWTYSDFMWKLVRGKDAWMINREPKSTHLRLLQASGFTIVRCDSITSPNKLRRNSVAKRFRDFQGDDLTTSGVFIQAVKHP